MRRLSRTCRFTTSRTSTHALQGVTHATRAIFSWQKSPERQTFLCKVGRACQAIFAATRGGPAETLPGAPPVAIRRRLHRPPRLRGGLHRPVLQLVQHATPVGSLVPEGLLHLLQRDEKLGGRGRQQRSGRSVLLCRERACVVVAPVSGTATPWCRQDAQARTAPLPSDAAADSGSKAGGDACAPVRPCCLRRSASAYSHCPAGVVTSCKQQHTSSGSQSRHALSTACACTACSDADVGARLACVAHVPAPHVCHPSPASSPAGSCLGLCGWGRSGAAAPGSEPAHRPRGRCGGGGGGWPCVAHRRPAQTSGHCRQACTHGLANDAGE